MTIFYRDGTKPDKEKVKDKDGKDIRETNLCNTCVPVMGNIVPDAPFDTEQDARTAWLLFRKNLVETWGKKVWDNLWDEFKCKNKDCKNKKACGNKPTYVEVGTTISRPPGQLQKFKLYLMLAREIQCVKEEPPPGDVVPVLPDPEPKKKTKKDEPKEDDKKTPGNEDEGMDENPKMMFVTFDEAEFRVDATVQFPPARNGSKKKRRTKG